MLRLDQLHLEHPVYGSRRLVQLLHREGRKVNRKRVMRLMGVMGIEAIYPQRKLPPVGPGHEVYPYLLEDLDISGPDQVWCSDITYVPMQRGFMYLVAVMDWWSRYVLAWELSNTMEPDFCIAAWERALQSGQPSAVDFQHRSRTAVHVRRVHRCGGVGRGGGEHGQPGSLDGQPVHRAAVAIGEVRGHLPAGLPGRTPSGSRVVQVVHRLQCLPASPVAQQRHPGAMVSGSSSLWSTAGQLEPGTLSGFQLGSHATRASRQPMKTRSRTRRGVRNLSQTAFGGKMTMPRKREGGGNGFAVAFSFPNDL